MTCCGCEDEPKDDEVEGPTKEDERGCTDVLCCCLLLLYWVGMVAIFCLALLYGNPYSVIYGKDYGGYRCGRSGDGVPDSSLPKVFYPRLSKDLSSQPDLLDTPWKLRLYGLCVAECPKQGDAVFDYGCSDMHHYPQRSQLVCQRGGMWVAPLSTQDVANRCMPVRKSLDNETVVCAIPDCEEAGRPCYTEQYEEKKFWLMDERSVVDVSVCVTQVRIGTQLQYEAAGAGPAQEKLAAGMQGMNQLVMTIMESKLSIFLFGIVAPIVLGFIFIFLMRWAAAPIVYLGIFILFTVLIGATVLVAFKAGFFGQRLTDAISAHRNTTFAAVIHDMQAQIEQSGYSSFVQPEEANAHVYELATVGLTALTIAYVAFLCIFSSQIGIAVEIVEEGSSVIAVQPSSLFYPFLTIFAMTLLSVYFMVGGVFIGTLNNDALEGAVMNFTDEVNAEYDVAGMLDYANINVTATGVTTLKEIFGVYHLFGFLWTLNFFLAGSTTVIAGSVSFWFFYRNNSDEYPVSPVLASLWMVVRYHLGSMAFGSLVLAVVQAIRIVLEYINQQTKEAQESSSLLKCAMACVRCCMWCFEKCIKFVSGYAYIYIALNGDSFCSACKATFSLFLQYPAQVSINAFVQTLLRVIQCVALPLSCSVACYYNAAFVDGSTNPLLPSIFALVLGYAVTRVFSGVYETTIDTIFVCAMRDKEKFGGRHTPQDLARVLGIAE